jgi:hypothetical protein
MRANGDAQVTQVPQGTTTYQSINSQYHISSSVTPVLPPISSMEPTGAPRADNISSVRHQYTDNGHSRHQLFNKQPSVLGGSGPGKRPFPISSPTSADSSDVEEDGGELPASGLVAPWEVLRGLADVAIQRAAKASRCNSLKHFFYSVRCLQENGEASEPQSRTRSPSPDLGSRRPSKRRKFRHKPHRVLKFPDGKQSTSILHRSMLIQMRKWYQRVSFLKQRLPIYSRCDFRFLDFDDPF